MSGRDSDLHLFSAFALIPVASAAGISCVWSAQGREGFVGEHPACHPGSGRIRRRLVCLVCFCCPPSLCWDCICSWLNSAQSLHIFWRITVLRISDGEKDWAVRKVMKGEGQRGNRWGHDISLGSGPHASCKARSSQSHVLSWGHIALWRRWLY